MESRKLPALLAVVGVIVAVALFLLLKDDTADTDTELGGAPAGEVAGKPAKEHSGRGDAKPKPQKPAVASIEIKNGEPVGGVADLKFTSGKKATFKATSDVADELHFHGYDAYIDLPAGKTKTYSFAATIEGVFELESHTTGVLVAEISVVPN